jgi:hypothetical protein
MTIFFNPTIESLDFKNFIPSPWFCNFFDFPCYFLFSCHFLILFEVRFLVYLRFYKLFNKKDFIIVILDKIKPRNLKVYISSSFYSLNISIFFLCFPVFSFRLYRFSNIHNHPLQNSLK